MKINFTNFEGESDSIPVLIQRDGSNQLIEVDLTLLTETERAMVSESENFYWQDGRRALDLTEKEWWTKQCPVTIDQSSSGDLDAVRTTLRHDDAMRYERDRASRASEKLREERRVTMKNRIMTMDYEECGGEGVRLIEEAARFQDWRMHLDELIELREHMQQFTRASPSVSTMAITDYLSRRR